MTITAADIRREVKEKNVTFLRLMFSDIAGTLKKLVSNHLTLVQNQNSSCSNWMKKVNQLLK